MYKSLIAATAVIGIAALMPVAPAEAGHGSAVGAGLAGFGVGAILGSALAPREVYVVPPPPPPPPVYYGPVVYGPPAWTPAWYDYCGRYPGFDPRTGYYVGPGGRPYFCR
jgi:hypothetical protein